MDLKVGMYVRTKNGRIAKIEYIENGIGYCDNWLYRDYEDYIDFIELDNKKHIEKIIKTSFNIIDLICESDYVNGLPVTKISEDIETGEKYLNLYGCISEWGEEDIINVATKEEFDTRRYYVR